MEGVESIVCLRVTHRTSKHLKYYIKMLLITDYTFIEFHQKKAQMRNVIEALPVK